MESNVYIDTEVSTEEFYKYERSIQVRLDGFSFSIIDGTKEVPSIIAYGEEMVVATPLPLLSVELERWIQTLPFLNEEFKRTTIVFDLDRVITLPVDLFNPDDVSRIVVYISPILMNRWTIVSGVSLMVPVGVVCL